MCDSLSFIAWLDEDMTEAEYEACRYPARDLKNTDHSWIEFRPIFPTPISPLTGAGFKITPIGMAISGDGSKRARHGRIAAYQVDFNPPACIVGHNRQLVNGVYQAAIVGAWLLKYWLAENGCTESGLEKIKQENIRLINVVLTFLFSFDSEQLAREALSEFRTHTEALLNKENSTNKIAYSYPPVAPPDPDAKYTYTSYVKMREFKISAYVKELDQPNAFLMPIKNDEHEREMQDCSVRTLRLENSVHGKWLKENDLDRISQWRDNPKAYEKVFNLIRQTLRFYEGLRTHRLKRNTVATLKLSSADKELLIWHLSYQDVREHPILRKMGAGNKQNKYFSDVKRRICDQTKVDIATSWEAQHRKFSTRLSELLVYPGEFIPAEHLQASVYSRLSVPVARETLKAMVDDVLQGGEGKVQQMPNAVSQPGPSKTATPARRARGIGIVYPFKLGVRAHPLR